MQAENLHKKHESMLQELSTLQAQVSEMSESVHQLESTCEKYEHEKEAMCDQAVILYRRLEAACSKWEARDKY